MRQHLDRLIRDERMVNARRVTWIRLGVTFVAAAAIAIFVDPTDPAWRVSKFGTYPYFILAALVALAVRLAPIILVAPVPAGIDVATGSLVSRVRTLVRACLEAQVPKLSQVRPEVSEALAEVIEGLLQRDPEDRDEGRRVLSALVNGLNDAPTASDAQPEAAASTPEPTESLHPPI